MLEIAARKAMNSGRYAKRKVRLIYLTAGYEPHARLCLPLTRRNQLQKSGPVREKEEKV